MQPLAEPLAAQHQHPHRLLRESQLHPSDAGFKILREGEVFQNLSEGQEAETPALDLLQQEWQELYAKHIQDR